MNRRTLLLSIAAVGGGGAVVGGTGAFTSVEADRDVAVRVADDANAFLSLAAIGPNAPYVQTTDGQLSIDLTGDNPTGAGGQGVNADAITVFQPLFEIRNRGTQEIDVSATPLTVVDTTGGDVLLVLVVPTTNFPAVTLAPGEAEQYSLIVDSYSPTGADLAIDDTITIRGEAT
jgi:hypothetical protein